MKSARRFFWVAFALGFLTLIAFLLMMPSQNPVDGIYRPGGHGVKWFVLQAFSSMFLLLSGLVGVIACWFLGLPGSSSVDRKLFKPLCIGILSLGLAALVKHGVLYTFFVLPEPTLPETSQDVVLGIAACLTGIYAFATALLALFYWHWVKTK